MPSVARGGRCVRRPLRPAAVASGVEGHGRAEHPEDASTTGLLRRTMREQKK